jgi:hypothetical protein
MDLEELQRELGVHATGNERLPQLLAIFGRILREQSEFSREIPLLRVALAVRWLYSAKHITTTQEVRLIDEGSVSDVISMIRLALAETRNSITVRYVRSGKVPAELLEMYRKSIEGYLANRFAGQDGPESLFENLKAFLPGLTRQEYQRTHRARLEYMARQIQELVLERLRAP